MSTQLRLRADAVAWREVDGGVIALGLDSSTYFGANNSGSMLWKLLAAGTTRADMVSELVSVFGIADERAEADVEAFVDDLRSRNLLET